MSETRKIAAILAADIVGFSRMASADEDRTLARLRALRAELIDPTIAGQNGRVFKRTGDGALVEFRSVVEAVRCAIAIQNAMIERNVGISADQRIEFRIGIHLGDVVEESDRDLMGGGVNIAARLEGIAEPNGLCLSSAAYEQVRDKLKGEFVDLGEKELKNIARPVRAYALSPAAIVGLRGQGPSVAPAHTVKRGARRWAYALAACVVAALGAGWFGWRTWSRSPTLAAASDLLASAPRLSLVVLPFENLSGDPEQEFFADGITDDLTTDLSHLPESFVIARNTAFTYKGRAVDVKQIGRELGVRYVLEGSVRRLGEKITANAQLISTETGSHVWADRFDGERSRLGELQVEFVARLANSLGLELVKAESLRVLRERPTNPDAIDLAMRGWVAWYNGGTSGVNVNEAIDDFERALRIDPEQPEALVGLSRALASKIFHLLSVNPVEDANRALALASKALSAHPENASAHLAKAFSILAGIHAGSTVNKMGQLEVMVAEIDAAIADDRNLAEAYATAGLSTVYFGRAAEGFSGLETALRLSPHDPTRFSWEYQVCTLHLYLAQWDQAIEWCRKSIATQPYLLTFINIAAAYAWTGHDADARAAVAELLKLKPGFTIQMWAKNKRSDNPTYLLGLQRLVEGLRKAGLPEE